MKDLVTILVAAREAQDLSQRDLARMLSVNRSTIAKFETCTSTLSAAKTLEFARAVHMNPAFVETGMGRPFLPPPGEGAMMKLLVAEDENGLVDDRLIMLATQGGGPLRVIFVIAPEGLVRYKVARPGCFYALAFRADGMLLLFRRRKWRLPVGDITEYITKIKDGAGDTTPEFDVHRGSLKLFTAIRAWSPEIDLSEISVLAGAPPDGMLLRALIDAVWPRIRGTELEADYSAARAILSTMREDELKEIAASIVKDIAKVLKTRITKKG